jgi:hypothetical protein
VVRPATGVSVNESTSHVVVACATSVNVQVIATKPARKNPFRERHALVVPVGCDSNANVFLQGTSSLKINAKSIRCFKFDEFFIRNDILF